MVSVLSTVGRRTVITIAILHGLLGIGVALFEPGPGTEPEDEARYTDFRELFPEFATSLEENQRIAGTACAALAVAVIIAYVGSTRVSTRQWLIGWMLLLTFVGIAIVDTEDPVTWIVIAGAYAVSQILIGIDIFSDRTDVGGDQQ